MSDDPTKILESEKAPTTNPMLEAILARVNDLAESLNSFRAEVNERFAEVDRRFAEVNERLDTLHRDIRRVDVSMDKLHSAHYEARGEIVELRLKQRELETRIENLERKAS